MSGGISAIKGFDYQATVILDRLLDHFEQHGVTAQVQPEGDDDLDLYWTENATEYRRYEQIKKEREDNQGNRTPAPWTLTDVINELLPNTITRLLGNRHEQVWIVGDEIEKNVDDLLQAGLDAPTVAGKPYWTVVHRLARNDAIEDTKGPLRTKLQQWRVPDNLSSDPANALSRMVREFGDFSATAGCDVEIARAYQKGVESLHDCLPGILARIHVETIYGSEEKVRARVQDRLEQRYKLPRAVVEDTLFRNLRGFISDVSKRIGRTFGQAEFEVELRCVWPQMIPIKDPPLLEPSHIPRLDLAERLTTRWSGKATEIVGISGSGKTSLAAEVIEKSRAVQPGRKTYYAEVRPDVRLRDVLSGVGFHLRRDGIDEPFNISIDNTSANEAVLIKLARSYAAVPQPLLLLIDLVEGTCSDTFARDLATFVRHLSSSDCRIAILGQESALRELTGLEKDELSVSQLDMRGFSFEEFATLVAHYHQDADRPQLWNMYHHLTAGRAAGLFAKLAQAIASADSLQEMFEIAETPAEDILAVAERRRFARISASSRSAAEKLVCFAMPFRRSDAEEIFPTDNVGSAIHEMLGQGLLRRHDGDSFEMHETVRAGLEGNIAVGLRNSAHLALAEWYGRHGLLSAEVFHLDKAGQHDRARERARAAFLEGKQWSALAAYVTRHKLVSPAEVIRIATGLEKVDGTYLLPSILRDLAQPVAVDELLRALREQPERSSSDYQWALAVSEAILQFEPGRLYELIQFCVEMPGDRRRKESALGWLRLAASRKNGVIESHMLDYFGKQSPEIKRMLVPLMLVDGRREVLREVFKSIASDQEPFDERQRSPVIRELPLRIGSRQDAIEFLAAMPAADFAAMLTVKSPLLGPLAGFVWSQRKALNANCIEILRDATAEEAVLEGAVRILAFLGEPTICALCDPLATRGDRVGQLAKLVPALVPALCDHVGYERKVLDRNLKLEDRVLALSVLALAGANLGAIYHRLKATEVDVAGREQWDRWFLALCAHHPFVDAIPIFEKHLASADAPTAQLLIPILTKLGELPVPEATTMLVRALPHPDPGIRLSAAVGLTQRRSRRALASLIDHYAQENDEKLTVSVATAIVASGPRSVADLRNGLHDSTALQLWQCILTARLCDETADDFLVTIASDSSRNWQLRRAAIFAAGRLPYKIALEKIVPQVMAERSPLVMDGTQNLFCHSTMASIILTDARGMLQVFTSGKARFVEFFGEIFEECWKASSLPQGLPTGAQTAEWLFDRLSQHGWPTRAEAPDLVLNELHIPILQCAVLRSLRLCGRPDIIEKQVAQAHHLWLAVKCLMERFRAGARDAQLGSRLKELVQASPCRGEPLLDRIIAQHSGSDAQPMVAAPGPSASEKEEKPAISWLNYADAVRALSGERTDFKANAPLILESIDAGQFQNLVRLADPANDYHHSTETYIPSLSFTEDGHRVSQRRVTTTGEPAAAGIRPAIAAANKFGIEIPWHRELMSGVFASTYLPRFLACLAARGDGDQLYAELSQNADVLLPQLHKVVQTTAILNLVDERIIPFLSRYVASGTDEFFEALCMLARKVDSPAIDPILAGLLYRWTQRFDMASPISQHDENHTLWRGLNRLSEHPRFNLIDGWQSRLAAVMRAQLRWYHRQIITRILERDARSYVLIECLLFKETNWEHFNQEEIDRLDAAAGRLFFELLEE